MPRSVDIEAQLTTQEIVRVEATQHQVGVGDGGLRTTRAVAGRPRFGPRAARPDTQQSTAIDPAQAAAASAYFDEVHYGRQDRIAASFHQAGAGK